jgi:hypothetical protein
MIGLALIAAAAFTAWTIWEGAKRSVRRLPPIPVVPVVVNEETLTAVEQKARLLDEIFDTLKRPADDEVDPPTVVSDKR